MGRWFTPGYAERHPERTGPIRDAFIACDHAGYAICCEAIGQMDLRPLLQRIEAPTLVMAGRDDPATPPAMAETICAGIRARTDRAAAGRAPAGRRAGRGGGRLPPLLPRSSPRGGRGPWSRPLRDGVENRRSVLGAAHVERSLAQAGGFGSPWQDFITRIAWGEIWGDPRLPWKTRSLITLAMMVALDREEEFKLHLRPALTNGVDAEELQALLLQTAIYAGVPAANGAFRWVREALGDDIDRRSA